METIRVNLGSRSYNIDVQAGALANIGNWAAAFPVEKKVLVVADENTASLFGEQAAGPMLNPEGEQMVGRGSGKARGKLCGGNLSLIADLMGTPYELRTKGNLLFIEEVGEAPYQIDRMLTQLRLAGKLDDCAGIVLGDFANCESDKKRDETLSLEEVLRDILPKNKPTIANVRAGHCDPNMILPLYVEYEIDGDAGTLTLLEKPTE